MVELYTNEGLSVDDASKIVEILVSNEKYKPFFVDTPKLKISIFFPFVIL